MLNPYLLDNVLELCGPRLLYDLVQLCFSHAYGLQYD